MGAAGGRPTGGGRAGRRNSAEVRAALVVAAIGLAVGAGACGGTSAPPSCRQVCEAQVAADPSVSQESCNARCVARVVRMRADAATVLLQCLLSIYTQAGASGPAECQQAAIDAATPVQTAAAARFATECQVKHSTCGGVFDLTYCALAPALLEASLGRTTTCIGLDCPQIGDCLVEATGGIYQ